MASLFDYISWRGDLSFSQSPLNPVDFLILCQLSYFPFDGIVPEPGAREGLSVHLAIKKLMEKLQNRKHSMEQILSNKEGREFINAVYLSNRFKNCQLLGFINRIDLDQECQLSAICVYTDDGSWSVVFRGTDTSLIGWKESFNICVRDVIPAQMEAVKYLKKMAPLLNGSLRIGGHSKGGNLAIFASSFCGEDVQKRISDIFSLDAPGFNENVIASEGFMAIKDRIKTYIPQTSVVGMLFEHGSDFNIVKSRETGLMQHSLFSWEVTHNDMIRVNKVTPSSRFADKTLREWINNLDNKDREKVIEAMYTILSASDIKSIHDLEDEFIPSMGKILMTLGNIDERTKKLIRKAFIEFLRSARRNINTLLETN